MGDFCSLCKACLSSEVENTCCYFLKNSSFFCNHHNNNNHHLFLHVCCGYNGCFHYCQLWRTRWRDLQIIYTTKHEIFMKIQGWIKKAHISLWTYITESERHQNCMMHRQNRRNAFNIRQEIFFAYFLW